MPDLDLDLETAGGPIRVFSLLHDARPLFLDFAGSERIDISPWADRVRVHDVRYAGVWELPVLGEVAAPSAALVRPDGHVAWVDPGGDDSLADALTRWLGPRR